MKTKINSPPIAKWRKKVDLYNYIMILYYDLHSKNRKTLQIS